MAIRHVFVLMLENRSFDHMLGFSGISGTDAVTGQPTRIDGLGGAESNTFNGQTYGVKQPASFTMPADPDHEFLAVLEQLCGSGAKYVSGGAYPPVVNSGFVSSYAASGAPAAANPGEIMLCYSPGQLPVLNALAREFAVCDGWHASVPGPTWPNRLFAHAASSSGLDHSPTTAEIVLWETLQGFSFAGGTIFERMDSRKVRWRLYAGDDFPMVAALQGIQLTLVHPYADFAKDIADPEYPPSYTFIEPSYNALADYKCSTSQHPLDDVTRGEKLIKCTYEAIRNSPLWNESLFIVTWDEHGGFYDHAVPPPARAPGDTAPGSEHNQYGFTFEQYGVRVPAVVVSPLIPRNLVDHRIYDHASILATVEDLFGLQALTKRDGAANSVVPLASLTAPRTDTPATLPDPANSGATDCPAFECGGAAPEQLQRPDDTVSDGNLPGMLHAALRSDLALSQPEQKQKIMAQFSALNTREQACHYVNRVRQKLAAARGNR